MYNLLSADEWDAHAAYFKKMHTAVVKEDGELALILSKRDRKLTIRNLVNMGSYLLGEQSVLSHSGSHLT